MLKSSLFKIERHLLSSCIFKTFCLVSGFLIYPAIGLFAQQSSLVYLEDGKLVYSPFAVEGQSNLVHVIPDFSFAGYKGGGVAIPDEIPVKATVIPESGDDTRRIQNAIDEVSSLSLDENGFRGVVLLKEGHYTLNKQLVIQKSGVVLRGEGQGKNQTVLHANLRAEHDVIEIKGADGLSINSSTDQNITTPYVPIGAYSFEVADASNFSVGELIAVTRTPNDAWINELGMDEATLCAGDEGCNGWTPQSYTIHHERIITNIEENVITIDIPIVDVMETKYGGGKIAKANAQGRINQCAVENLRVESFYFQGTDEDHAWTAVSIEDAENCWVRKVTGEYLAYSTVNIINANFTTVEDCAYIHPISRVSGGRRYSFGIGDGLGNLFQRCYSLSGRHDFVTGSRVTGPNVFTDGLGEDGRSDIGPHHRWATGILFENIVGSQIRVQNRGNSGSGHGWAGAQNMFWNMESYEKDIKVESPLGSINWGIGCTGPIQEGDGYWESWGTKVLPRSLYLQQLQDRLGPDAVDNIATPQQLDGSISDQLASWKGIGSIEQGASSGEIPEISFTKPNSSITVGEWDGNDIELSAVDNDGTITEVTLLINGEPIGSDTEAPYIFENVRFILESLSDEVHFLAAVAEDNDGNVAYKRLAVFGAEKEPIDLDNYDTIDLCNSFATHHNADSDASKTIDGNQNPESRWSAEEYGVVLVVEACEARYTDVIGIKWYRGDERQAIFDLEVSLDSINWTSIYSGNSSGTSSFQESFNTTGDSIKFMRYTGYGNTDSRWNSIVEVGFYKYNPPVDDNTTTILSINNADKESKLEVFPNPGSRGNITVKSPFDDNTRLVVFDMYGRSHLNLQSNNGYFEFSSEILSNGIYLIRAENGSRTAQGRLVIAQ